MNINEKRSVFLKDYDFIKGLSDPTPDLAHYVEYQV